MGIIEINSPEDIKKLIGCHIHDAKIVHEGMVGRLELQLSHITMPNKVSLSIGPEVQLTIGRDSVTLLSGLTIGTHDIPEGADE